jgi:hypothetical protein
VAIFGLRRGVQQDIVPEAAAAPAPTAGTPGLSE